MLDLQHKTILITGASSGIGRQCAITFSQLGATLILMGRDESKLRETVDLLNSTNHIYYALDLKNYSATADAINDALQKKGKISGFVHSAGMEITVPLNFIKPELYENVFSINVFSAFEIIKILSSKKNIPETGASYVLIASIMGILGQPGKLTYCASKAALINGAKSLALELANKSIRVNCISPGIVETPLTENLFKQLPNEAVSKIKEMHPLGFGLPSDIANIAAFLISDLTKWITGTNIIADGGYSAQ